MNGYLLDTNVLAETVKKQPDAKVLSFIANNDTLWICTVSIQELVFGAEQMPPGKRREEISRWIADLAIVFERRVLQMDWQAAALAGRFKNMARTAGLNGVELDSQIAGIAVNNDLVLATRNIKDFTPMQIELINPWE